jgi:hypothetical protein
LADHLVKHVRCSARLYDIGKLLHYDGKKPYRFDCLLTYEEK